MALRRRQKRTEQSKIDATPPWETRHHDEPPPTSGPYDARDAPDDELARIDLGALRVPVRAGMEMRLDMNEAQQVVGVTLVTGAAKCSSVASLARAKGGSGTRSAMRSAIRSRASADRSRIAPTVRSALSWSAR